MNTPLQTQSNGQFKMLPTIPSSDPLNDLNKTAKEENLSFQSEEFAIKLDERDSLKSFRTLFEYPKNGGLPYVDLSKQPPEDECIYLAGNSLGLMPKGVRDTMDQFLQQWSDLGVYGHHYGDHPWFIYDEELLESMCRLVGASTDEVAIMNQLTSCLHFLLLSFYRPTEKRFKILFEDKAFPSDHYAFESQVRFHGFDPERALITMKPRDGEHILRLEDVLQTIKDHGEEISVICFSGVQYYTGQRFEIPEITKCGHDVGAFVGWDLAHSVGNVEVELHDWNVDFAVWTTYKFLNSGAGNSGVAFLHSRLFNEPLPYLTGWWGHDVGTRMLMTNKLIPGIGIRKLRMSNPSALHCSALRASLKIFDMTDMKAIRAKSVYLTAYLECLLNSINTELHEQVFQIITPSDIDKRGAQLSVSFLEENVDCIHNLLKTRGVICDQRKPSVLRMAACPLYNSYLDVYRAYKILLDICRETRKK